MTFAYFPGCSIGSTAVTYKKSLEYVLPRIGVELREIPDWNCCGATSAHVKGKWQALALPGRNLALAEQALPGLDIAVPCSACYSRMKYASWSAKRDEQTRAKMEQLIGMPLKADNEVLTILEIFNRPEVMQACRKAMVRTLEGFPVACYYGCLTSRPREVVKPDSTEMPMQMDTIVSLTGARPGTWDFKTECCGASHQVDAPKQARPLVERIFRNAKLNGARAIVTSCPLCNMNLDMREEEINEVCGTGFDLPVFQFTELLAVCMGANAGDIGLKAHFYPAYDVLNEALRKAGEAG